MERRDKKNYYLDIADTVLSRSTCLRKKYGAIIVKNDEIIATGYNGAPRGRKNCTDIGTCVRKEMNIPRGHRYEVCRSVHAEANALLSAPREKCIGATIYMACRDGETGEIVGDVSSCSMCKRLIINSGVERVIIRNTKDNYTIVHVRDWIFNDDTLTGNFGY